MVCKLFKVDPVSGWGVPLVGLSPSPSQVSFLYQHLLLQKELPVPLVGHHLHLALGSIATHTSSSRRALPSLDTWSTQLNCCSSAFPELSLRLVDQVTSLTDCLFNPTGRRPLGNVDQSSRDQTLNVTPPHRVQLSSFVATSEQLFNAIVTIVS